MSVRIMSAKTLLALALFASAFAGAAGAAPADISGSWSLRTSKFEGCMITGEMTIARGKGGAYSCAFKTKQTCGEVVGSSIQTCVAKRDGDKLSIKSTVKSFEWSTGYDPDDFELTIKSGGYMRGGFASVHEAFTDEAIVEFYRGDAPVS
jgi:hypothetical protein